MDTKLSFAKQPFCYGSHHFLVISYGNRELSYQKRQSKRPLRSFKKFTFKQFFLDRESEGLFGFVVFHHHHSVFITHNSKLVGPTAEEVVWICFQFLFPSLSSLIFE